MTMPATPSSMRRRAVVLGLPLLCVVLTLGAYALFGGGTPLQARGYRVAVPIPDAQSLLAGSDVRSAGVKIGRVVAIRRAGNAAVATIQLDARYAPLRAGATAISRTKTLLGEGYLELALGPASAPAIPEDGSLAATQVRRSVRLDEFVSTFDAQTRARLRSLFGGMARALDDRGPDISDTLGAGGPGAANADAVLRTLDGQTAPLTRLVADAGTVFDALGRRDGALGRAVRAGNAVLATTAHRDTQLAATIGALPPFLRTLRATSDAITATSPDLERATRALTPAIGPVDRALGHARELSPDLRRTFAELGALTQRGNRGLGQLTRVVRTAPALLRTLYPALRELNPFVQLLATYRVQGLVAPLATAVAGGGSMIGPGGKIAVVGTGSLYVSNETISGWIKRLPSDRSNPYPRPDAIAQFQKQGFLSSYDCRNVHNPAYLPPLGTGSPPCVEQGPWNYRGKVAYFPRLLRSPP